VVGYLAIAVGASADAGHAVRAPSELSTEASLASLVTPYVPVLLALSVITFEMEIHHHVDRFSWLTGFGLALLVIARQALLLLDHRHELFFGFRRASRVGLAEEHWLAAIARERAGSCRGPSLSGEARELQPDTSGTLKRRQATLRRPYERSCSPIGRTSSIAVFDLYLFASPVST